MGLVCGAPSSVAGVTMPTSGGGGGGGGGTSQCSAWSAEIASLTTTYNNAKAQYGALYQQYLTLDNYDIAHGIQTDPKLAQLIQEMGPYQQTMNSAWSQIQSISAEMQAAGCF